MRGDDRENVVELDSEEILGQETLDDITLDMDTVKVDCIGKKRVHDSYTSSLHHNKGKKISVVTKLEKTLNHIVDAVESNATSTRTSVNPGSTIADVLKLLGELPEVTIGCPLYMLPTSLFIKASHREMFV